MPGPALITGASAGIGRAFACVFARHGHDLLLTARDGARLHALRTELEADHGVAVRIIEADLSDPESPGRLHAAAGPVDYLVNNAGVGALDAFAAMDTEKIEGMLAINIAALTRLTRLFLPDMLQRRRGHILNVASTAAFQPGPLLAVYYASKAYVLSLSEALSNEAEASGVKVTALCPGPTRSDFHHSAGMHYSGYLLNSMPTAEAVAAYGYRAMLRGKRVAVHGRRNRMLAAAARLAPRGLLLALGRKLAEGKREPQ